MPFQSITCRLDREQLRRLDLLSRTQGQTRAEVLRLALDTFLRSSHATPANTYRMAQTTEYMQAVADLLVNREMPEKRDAILATVAQRLDQFHGGR
jgi:predicted transcriptional regulator